ncbi:hypothetical protein RR48_02772 [Papilio machaon]|uniref:Uncharacterized protein n=1 Tax=Papilio machaon TaxID=76193 RepID=A0A0N1PHV9_PAPMA|nr:hypothetical protein RR48_02772 [Papilio machaon]
MLAKSLFCIFVLTTFLKLCHGDCHSRSSDLNSRWRQVDVMEKYAHSYLQHLPVLDEDNCDKQKHFVAIFSQALVEYAANNITDHSSAVKEAAHNTKKLIDKSSNEVGALGPDDNDDDEKRFVSVFSHTLFLYVVSNKTDEADRIKDAAHRTRNKLDNAADQLAGPIRALISLALLYVEGPLTDVQIACPYYVREHDCKDTLSKLQADKMKQCPGYKDNIDLYNRGASLINSCGLENLLEELALESSKGGDMEAINLLPVLLLITVRWQLCHGQCHTVATDLNTQWRGADVLERYARNYYSSLAVGPDDACNKRKRFASVFSEAMLQYFTSNITDRDEAIRDAVAKTEKKLYKPADIIGSEFRAKITYIYSFVDQPLSDIQAVCPYNIREPECEKRFKQIRNERLQLCPDYLWNVELYSTAVFLVTNCGFQNLIVELMRESATGEMSYISVAVVILMVSWVSSDLISGDMNSKWRPNNVLISNIDNYYKMLAIKTSDVDNRRKRFVSIISQAYMYFVASDEEDRVKRVQEAVAKTKQDLKKPTDAIAGQTRAYLIILKTPIDQPINDIKVSCPPQAKQMDCLKALKKYQQANKASCKEYDRNLRLYDKYVEYITDPEFNNFVADIIKVSDNGDKAALAFFTYVMLIEYPEVEEKGREAYNLRANTTYPFTYGGSNSSIMRFIIICTIFACAAVSGLLHLDKNNKWRRNDDVFNVIDPFYYELSLESSDLLNPSKRFSSVVTLAISVYLKSNETDHEKRVKEALNRTRKELDKPSDAIGGTMRAILTGLRGIIDKPINDVKISCPPEADQKSCDEKLQRSHEKNEATCRGYMKNVDMYERIIKLIHKREVEEIRKEINRTRRVSDDEALRYFARAANGRHSKIMKEFREIYEIQSRESFNCNVLNLPIF